MVKTAKLLDTKKLQNAIVVDNKIRFSFNYSTFDWDKQQVRELMDDLIMVYGQLEDEKPQEEQKDLEPINIADIPF